MAFEIFTVPDFWAWFSPPSKCWCPTWVSLQTWTCLPTPSWPWPTCAPPSSCGQWRRPTWPLPQPDSAPHDANQLRRFEQQPTFSGNKYSVRMNKEQIFSQNKPSRGLNRRLAGQLKLCRQSCKSMIQVNIFSMAAHANPIAPFNCQFHSLA